MSTRKVLFSLAIALSFGAGAAVAEGPGLGKPISEADIKAWDIAILPDGTGLPPGSGTAAQGAPIYSQKCAMCHGENGVKPAPGYAPMTGEGGLDRIDAPKTVRNFWGHATTLFDIIRRGMPYQMPKTLTSDEVYALTAYVLSVNKLIEEKEVMNAETLPKVKMPNAGNFIIRFPERI